MSSSTNTDIPIDSDLQATIFPLPYGVKDPYGHPACCDDSFLAACAHSDTVWQQHQTDTRRQLQMIRNGMKSN